MNAMLSSLINDMHFGLKPAMEDLVDGKVHKEKEYVWYGKVEDFSVLKNAKGSEVQRQTAVKTKNGIFRVRKTVIDGAVTYALTAKSFVGRNERNECSVPVGEEMHNVFMAAVGESMDKTRYFFDAGNGLTWEVDIFTDLDGNPKPYCKIDLEVTQDLAEFPPLPIKLSEVVPPGDRTAEQQELVNGLNSKMFVNPVFTTPAA